MDGGTIISAKVPEAMRAKLAALAEQNDRSLSAELRRARRMYLRVEARDEEGPA